MIVYILPSYFHLWVLYEKDSESGQWQKPDRFWKWIFWFDLEKGLALFILIFGIIFSIVSIIVILVDVA
jgi:hypothetical protein